MVLQKSNLIKIIETLKPEYVENPVYKMLTEYQLLVLCDGNCCWYTALKGIHFPYPRCQLPAEHA